MCLKPWGWEIGLERWYAGKQDERLSLCFSRPVGLKCQGFFLFVCLGLLLFGLFLKREF